MSPFLMNDVYFFHFLFCQTLKEYHHFVLNKVVFKRDILWIVDRSTSVLGSHTTYDFWSFKQLLPSLPQHLVDSSSDSLI